MLITVSKKINSNRLISTTKRNNWLITSGGVIVVAISMNVK